MSGWGKKCSHSVIMSTKNGLKFSDWVFTAALTTHKRVDNQAVGPCSEQRAHGGMRTWIHVCLHRQCLIFSHWWLLDERWPLTREVKVINIWFSYTCRNVDIKNMLWGSIDDFAVLLNVQTCTSDALTHSPDSFDFFYAPSGNASSHQLQL